MGEIERRMAEQDRYRREVERREAEESIVSHTRTQEFISIMRARKIGKTALYEKTSHITPIRYSFFKPRTSDRDPYNKATYSYEHVGDGWQVIESDADGPLHEYAVLDTDEPGGVYFCSPNYRRYVPKKQSKNLPEFFLTVDAPMNQRRADNAFGGYNGVEILSDAIKHLQ